MFTYHHATRCAIVLMAFVVLFTGGCATIPVPTRSGHLGMDDPLGRCADFFDTLDRRVVHAQIIDPGAFKVPGHPYLRIDRFLASFREEVSDEAAFTAWVDRMQVLDQTARRYEIANLPDVGPPQDRETLYDRVITCGNRLKAADFQTEDQRRGLREKITAPDEYILLRQILGIYPITRLFISLGVSRWHAEIHRSFTVEPPADGSSTRYVPETGGVLPEPRVIVAHAGRDALGIPRYTADALEALFQHHAPVWEVRTQVDDDRIGTPFWTSAEILAVDTGRPVTFMLLSHTRFQGEILTQLNYMIWFPSRPKVHMLDIYGGLLDGLNYRVTLNTQGEPLLYETVHHCGCYYAAYPTRALKVRENIAYAEPPLILKAPDIPSGRQGMTVAMQSRTHFVHHLYPSGIEANADSVAYTLTHYDRLRSLDDGRGGRRSMFGPNSLAPGTERLERWLFWPTGVLSPGAMRQWGRHAVAFVGERHFDDPFFMEEMFEVESYPN